LEQTPLDLVSQTFIHGDEKAGGAPGRQLARLFLDGLLYAAFALALTRAVHLPHSGPFAVFLAAAGLTRRFDAILEENRRAIYERAQSSRRANATSSAAVLSLFLGMFAAFAAAALLSSELQLSSEFSFVFDAAQLGDDTILSRRFGGALGLFVHNVLVLSVFCALAFVYRAYGALLVLSWNACIWGLVLTFLTRRGLASSEVHPALFVSASAFAVLPHLVLEASGYVLASLAAIYLSQAVTKYSPSEAIFRDVLRAVLALTALAFVCLFLGAVVESTLPRFVLSLLAG
jgi:hypothetical protein